ncbi:MAG: hypothetical protein J5883_03655 [Clostridiales bacterium]|nr:hypothetical protein [Clostridiales bacterium]
MKKIKTIIAGTLVASMLFSATACSLGGGKFGPSKLAAYCKGEGAELYTDSDDWEDDLDDLVNKGDYKIIKDGIYVHVKGDDVKEYLKSSSVTNTFYDKAVKDATVYIIGNEKSGDTTVVMAAALTFDNKDDALDFYEDGADGMEDDYKDDKDYSWYNVDFDTFEEGSMQYALFFEEDTDWEDTTVGGIYLQGTTVFFIIGKGDSKKDVNGYVDDICEGLGVAAPSEL